MTNSNNLILIYSHRNRFFTFFPILIEFIRIVVITRTTYCRAFIGLFFNSTTLSTFYHAIRNAITSLAATAHLNH